ncbi:MAG: LytTR family transcriptional regulator DNA-binding domain-containing protein [Emergencia sp.]
MEENYLSIISGSENARIRVSDIVMIQRNRRKLRVVTGQREFEYYEKIENVEPLLDDRFYPCLKGCYVNMERISFMADQSICFDNGVCYNMGRENYIRTKQKYKQFLREHKASGSGAKER